MPVIEIFAFSRSRLEDLTSAISATEALVKKMAAWIDAGVQIPVEAYVACKTSGPEFLWQATDHLMQLLGGRGYIETNLAPQLMRDARLLRIFEGPTETLNMFLGANVLQREVSIHNLLAEGFRCQEIANELLTTTTQLRDTMSVKADGSAVQRQWRQYQVGELATAAIIWAAATDGLPVVGTETVRWARRRFEFLRDTIFTAQPVRPAMTDSKPVISQINRYANDIGDVEQALPGEDDQLDGYLKKEADQAKQVEPFAMSMASPLKETPGFVPLTRSFTPLLPQSGQNVSNVDGKECGPELLGLVQEIILKYLRSDVDPNLTAVELDTSLLSLGVESIGAAAIALDIEKATGQHITPEIVFAHQTIRQLSAYLKNRPYVVLAAERIEDQSPDAAKAFGGSMAEFANLSGRELRERVAGFDAWRRKRQEGGVWPFYRLAQSPAAPRTAVCGDDGISRQSLNFASQDYLGLARDPRVLRKAQDVIAEYGVHSAGSPALLGTTVLMADLERSLAVAVGKEDCLVFPTGWAAGFGVITGLVRAHDTLVVDVLCHRCLMEGAYHVTREPLYFRHNDLDHLRQTLRKARERNAANGLFVVAESLYSMDSDSPDLLAMLRLVREFDAILILDVAHDFGSMGVRGLGLLEQLDGTGLAVDVVMGSFSKTFAATGGFVAADQSVSDYLRSHTTSFVFSNAISPVQAAVALECCKIAFSVEGNELRDRLSQNVLALRAAMQAAESRVAGTPSPIVPVFVGGERKARLTARQIACSGLLANLVEYPAVPLGQARFRFQVMSTHTPAMTREAATLFAQACQEVDAL